MNYSAIHPPAFVGGKRENKVHNQCYYPALNEFWNTNSFIKVKHYIRNIGTNLTLSKQRTWCISEQQN